MDPRQEYMLRETRRYFFGRCATGLGAAALGSAISPELFASPSPPEVPLGMLPAFHHRPTAKRVIWLFMADGPSQLDLYDYKPKLAEFFDKDLPDSVRKGQRITTMTSGQARLPVAPSMFKFAQHGQHGAWVSELLPHIGAHRRRHLCVVKSMHTEAINHDPAITFIQTGSELPGRPSIGAWLSLRHRQSESTTCRRLSCCISRLASGSQSQALFSRLWGSGLPADEASGRRAALAGRSGAVSVESARRRRPTSPPHARWSGGAESTAAAKRRAIPKSRPASPSTRWRSACRPRCPS